MKRNRRRDAAELLPVPARSFQPEELGLPPALYASALCYLFDRAVPANRAQGGEWFWDLDTPAFNATPLEWTRIQTVLFGNAARDLAAYDDEQVGMGLNYVMSNSVSDVPFAAIHASVPVEDAMRMMDALPLLWRDCFGPRLDKARTRIGAGESRLYFTSYMWFDVWPTFWNVRQSPHWRKALWHTFERMLAMPWREAQVAALHGIGHHAHELDRVLIDRAIEGFLRASDPSDVELNDYARAARSGCVQ